MAEVKTKATDASIELYIASRASDAQKLDCAALMTILGRVTGETRRMWGPSIVGYGVYHYLSGGKPSECCVTGFAIRNKELVVYILAEGDRQIERLSRLGKHKMGKSCLYFKRLADLDVGVLEALVVESVAETRRRHPDGAA